MTCSEANRYLADLSVGALSWLKRTAVRRHLRRCSACRLELARLNRVDAVLREDLRAPAAPADLWEAIRAALDDEPGPRTVRRSVVRTRVFSLAAAGVAAFLLVVLLLHSRTRPPAPFVEDASEYEQQYVIAGWRDPLADQATAVLVLAGGQTAQAPRPEGLR